MTADRVETSEARVLSISSTLQFTFNPTPRRGNPFYSLCESGDEFEVAVFATPGAKRKSRLGLCIIAFERIREHGKDDYVLFFIAKVVSGSEDLVERETVVGYFSLYLMVGGIRQSGLPKTPTRIRAPVSPKAEGGRSLPETVSKPEARTGLVELLKSSPSGSFELVRYERGATIERQMLEAADQLGVRIVCSWEGRTFYWTEASESNDRPQYSDRVRELAKEHGVSEEVIATQLQNLLSSEDLEVRGEARRALG